MAVYTQITRLQLEQYLAAFTLAPLADFAGIAAGVSNTNYRLTFTDGTKLILTLFEERTPWDDLPYFITLMEHLAERGIPCPRPIRAQDGNALQMIAAHPAAMVNFLPGVSVLHPTAKQCGDLGTLMGQMHQAGLDCPQQRQNSMPPAIWQDLLDRSNDGSTASAEKRAYCRSVIARWPTDLPRGAIHADLFPDNVFFDGNKLCGVIDFYFACHDFLAYDLAIALNAWCAQADGSLDPARARALLRAYRKQRPLTPAEIEALPLLLQGATLRFFSSRHYDWINRPASAILTPKDPTEYARILQFHRAHPHAVQDWL